MTVAQVTAGDANVVGTSTATRAAPAIKASHLALDLALVPVLRAMLLPFIDLISPSVDLVVDVDMSAPPSGGDANMRVVPPAV